MQVPVPYFVEPRAALAEARPRWEGAPAYARAVRQAGRGAAVYLRCSAAKARLGLVGPN